MKYLDLTLPSPEENLALDEALLNHAEDGNSEEILRFWEPLEHFAVLGYSNRSEENVNLNTIREDKISVLRRVSGGGTVLQGPGCLNYALILDIQNRKYLKNIKTTNCHIMKFHAKVLSHIKSGIEYEGTTDLAMGDLKFSGNAQRRKKRFCLFHGTFLLNMNIKLMEKYLNHPADQPDYRRNRLHSEFVTNLGLEANLLKENLKMAWASLERLDGFPMELMKELVRNRYSRQEWNFKY